MAAQSLRQRNSRPGSQSSYSGAPLQDPQQDDAVYYPQDDTHSFFAKGRDFESAYVNHTYTAEEKKTLATYESLDYLPSHSQVYKNWVKRQPTRLDWDRWVMMGLIGFSVGFTGFLLHQVIDVIADFKWDYAREFIDEGDLLVAWGWVLGYSLIFVITGAALVVFWRPSAGGSGMPELIGYLNGTIVRHIFNVQTMLVKFLSCCCAVGSGLPVGPEGPMIHLGSLFGAGVSQFKSDTLRLKLPFFERFRNSEDRRNFISAGAAAGVASAFGAPVGGLLFSMEEVSSFWNMKLSWQIFFCAMVSTFTTDLFNSAFSAFRYEGNFGLFKTERYILFQVKNGLAVNILAFIPSIILGILGGLLGAMFTFINLKIARTRKRLLAKIGQTWKQRIFRMSEPFLIMTIVATASVFLPSLFSCSRYMCMHSNTGNVSVDCINDTNSLLHTESDVQRYTCPPGVSTRAGNATLTNSTYNQVATLLFVTGEKAIHHLFSRNTHIQFDYGPLVAALVYYFILACWSAGTSISSGLVVPMLFIGGVYGRIVGLAMVSLFGIHATPGSYWAWMDPGAFALVGAASFFGGVSRLTVSLTVIMMEITNDIQFLLLIMVAIMVAKWVGDFFTHPLYHALLELKCIPFLDSEPVIVHEGKKTVNLELFCACDIMTPSPCILCVTDSVNAIASMLMNTPHGGYPVVTKATSGEHVFYGFINRLELLILLKSEDVFVANPSENLTDHGVTAVEYQELSVDKVSDLMHIEELLLRYSEEDRYKHLYLNLAPYVNQSAVSVQEKFSLHRTYIIFRTLGLRHLTVVDCQNRVVGVITRKDLMGFNMEDKLRDVLHHHSNQQADVIADEQPIRNVPV